MRTARSIEHAVYTLSQMEDGFGRNSGRVFRTVAGLVLLPLLNSEAQIKNGKVEVFYAGSCIEYALTQVFHKVCRRLKPTRVRSYAYPALTCGATVWRRYAADGQPRLAPKAGANLGHPAGSRIPPVSRAVSEAESSHR
jgi:hypothetical protein